MRLTRFAPLIACLAFAGSVAAALCCCGPDTIKLPSPVQRSVVVGGHFYGITAEGRLLDVDLDTAKTREFADFGVKLGPLVDARGGTICVSAGEKLLLVDAKTGKLSRELDCGANIRSFGFVAEDRLVVHTTKNLDVIDLKTGKVAESKPLSTPKDRFDSTAVHVVDGKVYVAKTFNSYGIPLTQLNVLDGKIGKEQVVRLPADTYIDGRSLSLVAGPGGSLYLTNQEGTFRYAADGTLAAKVQPTSKGSLIGFWNDQPVTLIGGRTLVIDMPWQTVKSK